MKYLKYIIAYLSLFGMFAVFYILYLGFTDQIKLGSVDSSILILGIFYIFSSLYDKFKPFSLTGNIREKLKNKWESYLNSQITCPFCQNVISRDKIKKNRCPKCNNIIDK